MSKLRNPFAVKDKAIIMIEDLSGEYRGLKCNCLCPSCNDAFIARMGKERVHHFAHSTEGCDEVQAYITGLYRLLKEIIDKGIPIYLPPVIVEFSFDERYPITKETIETKIKLVSQYSNSDLQIHVSNGKKYVFENAEYIINIKGQVQAIILGLQGKKMAVRVTPPDTVCKLASVSKYKDFPTLEIDFRNDEERIRKSNRAVLEQYISSNELSSRWIYNPIVSKCYSDIIQRSEALCKKAENLRKAKEDKAKKLEEENKKKIVEAHEYEQGKQNHLFTLSSIHPAKKLEKKLSDEEEAGLGYEDVKTLFTQQVEIIKDRFQTRWVQCEICNEIKVDNEFAIYGGSNHVNLGTCRICSRK